MSEISIAKRRAPPLENHPHSPPLVSAQKPKRPKEPKPKKLRQRRDPTPGLVVRGIRLHLEPKPAQAALLDLWRRRARELWNLLLRLEMAAYSGATAHSELGWREIWAEVAAINHGLALERRALASRMLADLSAERDRLLGGGAIVPAETLKTIERCKTILAGKPPQPPEAAKMRAHDLQRQEPKLFIWENDLQKLMARLKRVPETGWIGDLPSHCAQRVVKELDKALSTMLKERKKRAAGVSERKVGFPRFKPNRYAEGSLYFANTQISFDFDHDRIKFPGGVGWVALDYDLDREARQARRRRTRGLPPSPRRDRIPKGAKLMGARVWRQGETWWISPQFELPAPAPLPETGRAIGLKVAATVLATTYDGTTYDEIASPRADKRLARRLKLWNRQLARRSDAQKERERKVLARGKVSRRARVRLARSKGFVEACARLAALHAREAHRRNDALHKASRAIIDGADHVSIEIVNVAGMMRKGDHLSRKRQRRAVRNRGEAVPVRHKAPPKVLRRALRRVALARFLTQVTYKAADGGRIVTETHVLFPRVQICGAKLRDGSICGHLNMMMKDGRVRHECGKCGGIMHRNLNAAEVLEQAGRVSRESGLDAAE